MWQAFGSDPRALAGGACARRCGEAYGALERFDCGHAPAWARGARHGSSASSGSASCCSAGPTTTIPGLNHEIPAEFQKLGYPVLTQDSLPIDDDILERLFGEEVRRGELSHPMAISDVWKNTYSENTNRKVWAAKYVARHPNLVALELSNFKCGHDAPIYSVIEEIIESAGTPYFYFKDIDENKPAGSIKIRVETIDYFLKRYRENILARDLRRAEIEGVLAAYEAKLRAGLVAPDADLDEALRPNGGAWAPVHLRAPAAEPEEIAAV